MEPQKYKDTTVEIGIYLTSAGILTHTRLHNYSVVPTTEPTSVGH